MRRRVCVRRGRTLTSTAPSSKPLVIAVVELMKRYGFPNTYASNPPISPIVGKAEACTGPLPFVPSALGSHGITTDRHRQHAACVYDEDQRSDESQRLGAKRSASGSLAPRTSVATSSADAGPKAIPCPVKPPHTNMPGAMAPIYGSASCEKPIVP